MLNAERWRVLHRATNRCELPVDFEWIPGKKGGHAKAVDKLARDSAERPYSRPLSTSIVRPKIDAEREADEERVPMLGQVETAYIIEAQSVPLKRLSRYRYQLVGGDLDGALAWAYSKLHLRPRHTFRVRFNEDQDFPQIEEMLEEVEIS